GNWKLIAKANGKTILSDDIGTAATQGWQSYRVDLSEYAGQNVKLELENRATEWSNEFAFWGRISVASE
ncbi:MAG TPA: hypothetical protein VLA12_11215, partial [Planctomycetaceae bacterium]|nr:hypothetical protein [Planctomycetaceae bacterium]